MSIQERLREIDNDCMNVHSSFGSIKRIEIKYDHYLWFIEMINVLEQENGDMAEKHAEKDIVIAKLLTRIQELETIEKAYEALKKAL